MGKDVVGQTTNEAERSANLDILALAISMAVQIPGVKVDRESFLRNQFEDECSKDRNYIVEKGPVEAGCSQTILREKAHKVILQRTLTSAGASFAAGIPGGFALAATMPADTMQFLAI